MNEAQFKRIVSAVISDDTELPIIITISDAWMLVNSLQLTVRHPDLHSPLKSRLTDIAKQLEKPIKEMHPEAQEVMNMGWDQQFDDLF